MSLQVLDTVASLITVTIVAATAIAALIQLRHLRAANQIHALMSVAEKLNGPDFTAANVLVITGLEAALADPAFREYEVALIRNLPPPQVEQRFVDMHHAAVLVGNTFEMLGLMVKNQIVDAGVFLDEYCGRTTRAWILLASYAALGRDAMGSDTGWENFEYLVVLSEDWLRRNPSSYPKGIRRLELHNPWPPPKVDQTSD